MKVFLQLTFLQKLYLLIGGLVSLLLITGAFSIYSISSLNRSVDDISQRALPSQSASQNLNIAMMAVGQGVSDALSESELSRLKTLTTQFTASMEQANRSLANLAKVAGSNAADEVAVLSEIMPEVEKAAQKSLDGHRRQLENEAQAAVSLRDLQQEISRFKQHIYSYSMKTGDEYLIWVHAEFANPFEQMEAMLLDSLGTGRAAEVSAKGQLLLKMIPNLDSKFSDLMDELDAYESVKVKYRAELEPRWAKLKNEVLASGTGTTAKYLQFLELKEENQSHKVEMIGLLQKARELIQDLVDASNDRVDSSAKKASSVSAQGLLLVGVVCTISVIIALIAGFWMSRQMRGALRMVSKELRSLADGDMTVRVAYLHRDEFGKIAADVNMLAKQMQKTLSEFSSSAQRQNTIAGDNSQACAQASKELHELRDNIEQLAAAMTQMDASFNEVAKLASDSADQVGQVHEAVNHGSQIMNNTINGTNELSHQLQNTVEKIKEVEHFSDQIVGMLDVIRGIAEQTNLLALNAAIEAARAGEQGRGFAVVADEVRNLAQRTASSTKDIHERIDNLQQSIGVATAAVENASEKMQENVMQVSDADGAMESIRSSIGMIADMTNQISVAAEEQKRTTDEMTRNVSFISEAADANMQVVEKITATSNEQASMATELQALCNHYRV